MVYIKRKTVPIWERFYGAGDEARTRYLHLGKVALYRMSYTRSNKKNYSRFFENVNTFFIFFSIFFQKLRRGIPCPGVKHILQRILAVFGEAVAQNLVGIL